VRLVSLRLITIWHMPWISETDSIIGVCMNIRYCCLYVFWVKDLSTSATSHGTGRFCRLSIGTLFIITTFTGIFCNPLAIFFGLPLAALLDSPVKHNHVKQVTRHKRRQKIYHKRKLPKPTDGHFSVSWVF